MAENVRNTRVIAKSEPRSYFKVQLKAWTSFDPSRMELSEIADAIDAGSGFLTAIEVMKTVGDISAIDDDDVRQSFENILAAERIMANFSDLPKVVRDRLHQLVSREGEMTGRTFAA